MPEIVQARSESATHYDNEDGTRTAVIAPLSNYRDDSGTWQPVELAFTQVSTTEWVSDRNRYRVRAYRDAGVNWIEITHRATNKGVRWQVPLSATVGTDYVEFQGFGLTWRYYLTKTGVKLTSSPVSSSLGPRTYNFTAQLVGGATLPQVVAHGGLESDAFVVPRAVAYCADGVVRQAGAFSRSGTTVTFSMDDSGFPPEAYPYTIDPTSTFNITANANDAHVGALSGNASYPPPYDGANDTNATVIVQKTLSGGLYFLNNGLMRWDTSGLGSGATVTAATLRIRPAFRQDADSRSLALEWFTWTPAAGSSHYTTTVGTNAHAGTAISTLTLNADNDLTLTNVSNVNTTGYTGIRAQLTGTAPSGFNTITWTALDNASSQEARLIVTYTTGWTGSTAPDAILAQSNLSGTLADIDDDPDAADGSWLVVS